MDDLGQFQLSHERRLANCESWLKQHQEDIERLDKQQGDIKELISSVATIAQKQADMDAKSGGWSRKWTKCPPRAGNVGRRLLKTLSAQL